MNENLNYLIQRFKDEDNSFFCPVAGLLDISFVVTEEAAEMAPDILAASQNAPFYIDIQQEEQVKLSTLLSSSRQSNVTVRHTILWLL